jgi:thiamine-phosphate pyrophosphorylase
VIVNDRVDVALAAGADGVHLGMGDLPIVEARRICGDELLIGASTHSLDEARSAAAAGTDYCGVGAMFVSSTKDRAVSGPGYLRDYLGAPTLAEIPHLAIGGITIENIGVLAAAGCRGIAVSSAVCGAEDPEGVCRALLGAMVRGEGQDHGPAARAAP